MIPDHRLMSFTLWADSVNLLVASAAPPPKVSRDNDWHAWAEFVVSIPAIASFFPPDPYAFHDWRLWAERFIQSVKL